MDIKERMLLNFVYCRPVGHVVEGMRYAYGVYKANKNLEISIALNDKSATELAGSVDWIKNVYLVETDEILKYGMNAPCLMTRIILMKERKG